MTAQASAAKRRGHITDLRAELLELLREPRATGAIYAWLDRRGYNHATSHGYLMGLVREGAVKRTGIGNQTRYVTAGASPPVRAPSEYARLKARRGEVLLALVQPRRLMALAGRLGVGRSPLSDFLSELCDDGVIVRRGDTWQALCPPSAPLPPRGVVLEGKSLRCRCCGVKNIGAPPDLFLTVHSACEVRS